MAAKGFADIKIMIVDDQRNKLPDWVQTVCINMHTMCVIIWLLINHFWNKVLGNPAANPYVSGVGVHWYDTGAPFTNLDRTHDLYPDRFILGTEACQGNTILYNGHQLHYIINFNRIQNRIL